MSRSQLKVSGGYPMIVPPASSHRADAALCPCVNCVSPRETLSTGTGCFTGLCKT